MKRNFHFLIAIAFIVGIQACTERTICPAYQSAFIHDEETLRKKFSYFNEDSTPKILTASKDNHLIVEATTFRKKSRSLRTVEMKDIYPVKPDSLEFGDDMEFDLAERDLYDSADLVKEQELPEEVDSTYVISLKKEKFNIDQELYLWYFKKFLVYPDVRLQAGDAPENNGQLVAPEEKKGFFKRLFGKKKKKKKEEEGAVDEETGEIEKTEWEIETSATELNKKKGPFGFLKKKKDKKPKKKKEKAPKVKKEKKKKEKKVEEPPAPVEDEDDGEDDF